MGLAYVAGGAIPVLPYLLWPLATALPLSIAWTVAGLFALGVAKGRLVRQSWWASGFEMLSVAGVAAAVGYAIGSLVRGLLP